MISTETLFGYACTGDIEKLKEYYQSGEAITGRTFYKYGKEHSLIMGAFRNDQFETVEYLLKIGEKPTDEEKEQLKKELMRWNLMKIMVGKE